MFVSDLGSSNGTLVNNQQITSVVLRDGDKIHAVIKGSAVNNDGSDKVGFTAPSVRGQSEVIASAIATAGVEPGTIGYVECHGTATPLGDPIEIEGLPQADWVLIDAGDVLIHLFRPEVRAFYNLEKMWSTSRPSETRPVEV